MKRVKQSSVKNKFYTGNPSELSAQIRSFESGNYSNSSYKARAVIVPHAALVYSGRVAFEGINQLDKSLKTLIIFAPAHKVAFDGIAVSSYDEWESPTANISINEEIFQGHFPDYPVMPGVLIVEALAQVGAVAMLKPEDNRGRLAFFAGIDNCRFKRQVVPGDQLRLEVEMTRVRGSIGKGKGVATVNGELACEVEITFALGPK